MNCNQCGMCCKAIYCNYVSKSNGEFHNYGNNPLYVGKLTDREFIDRYWIKISYNIAKQLNPIFIEGIDSSSKLNIDFALYRCKFLKFGKCQVQSYKPHVCKDFPLYGAEKCTSRLYSKDCGYEILRDK